MLGGRMVMIEGSYRQLGGGKLEISRFEMSETDKEMVRIKKIRKTAKCYMCKKTLPKGSWCYGERYIKVCLECERDKYFPKILAELTRLLDSLKIGQSELNEKWEEYQRDNMLANLQHDG